MSGHDYSNERERCRLCDAWRWSAIGKHNECPGTTPIVLSGNKIRAADDVAAIAKRLREIRAENAESAVVEPTPAAATDDDPIWGFYMGGVYGL